MSADRLQDEKLSGFDLAPPPGAHQRDPDGALELRMGRLRRGLLLAPLLFVAHWLEESPGFVSWFNAHVTPDITQDTFWNVNAGGLVITVLVVLGYWATRSGVGSLLVVAWLSFLMLTNAILHISGAVVDRAYVPGLVTAIVLYLPFYAWVCAHVVRTNGVPIAPVVAAAVLGGLPMAIHGYLILFRGSRLF